MDEGDRELYLEEQVDEDECLDHMAKALDMVSALGKDGAAEVRGLLLLCARVREEGLGE